MRAGAIAIVFLAGLAGAEAKERALPQGSVASCQRYGPGFVEVPGTTTCIRIGGRVRAEYGATSGRSIDRDPIAGFGSSASVSADTRTDTPAGPLRTFVRMRAGGGPYGGR